MKVSKAQNYPYDIGGQFLKSFARLRFCSVILSFRSNVVILGSSDMPAPIVRQQSPLQRVGGAVFRAAQIAARAATVEGGLTRFKSMNTNSERNYFPTLKEGDILLLDKNHSIFFSLTLQIRRLPPISSILKRDL